MLHLEQIAFLAYVFHGNCVKTHYFELKLKNI